MIRVVTYWENCLDQLNLNYDPITNLLIFIYKNKNRHGNLHNNEFNQW